MIAYDVVHKYYELTFYIFLLVILVIIRISCHSCRPSDPSDPSWSPDGTKIAFDSYRDGNIEIYVMNADGSNQTRLTNNPGRVLDLSWSPFLPRN